MGWNQHLTRAQCAQMAHHLHRNTSPPPYFLRFPSPALRLSLLLLITLALLYAASVFLLHPSSFSRRLLPPPPPCGAAAADLSAGRWARASPRPLYDGSCPFHRNAWNCLRNGREGMDSINSWVWLPDRCGGQPIPRIDPAAFLGSMRGRKIGFVGDSLNENFLVALLCTLMSADGGAKKWKRKGAWRGGYFPKFDVVVAYHRAVLLAKYTYVALFFFSLSLLCFVDLRSCISNLLLVWAWLPLSAIISAMIQDFSHARLVMHLLGFAFGVLFAVKLLVRRSLINRAIQ